MKIRELIEQLENYDEDAEVRFVCQENWPFQDDIAGVWQADDARPASTASASSCGSRKASTAVLLAR